MPRPARPAQLLRRPVGLRDRRLFCGLRDRLGLRLCLGDGLRLCLGDGLRLCLGFDGLLRLGLGDGGFLRDDRRSGLVGGRLCLHLVGGRFLVGGLPGHGLGHRLLRCSLGYRLLGLLARALGLLGRLGSLRGRLGLGLNLGLGLFGLSLSRHL